MTRGFAAIGLDNPKDPLNVGSVLRAAFCFDASLVVLGGPRYGFHAASTDTQKAWRHVPVIRAEDLLLATPMGAIPIAVEIAEDASCLVQFAHPERAFYLFGPEDGNLRREIRQKCAATVSIPTRYCLNLAAAVNVILYDRQAKRQRP